MICKKCNKEIPDDSTFCCYCGYKLVRERKKARTANGTGYVFKRGQTWTVRVTTGWKELENGKKTPIQTYKGGFKTKKEAQDYVELLKSQSKETKKSIPTYEELFNKWYDHYTGTRNLSKDTTQTYRTAFGHMDPIKKLMINTITPATLQNIINECSSHRMRVLVKTVLKMTFDFAMDEYDLQKTPVRNLYLGENDSKQRPPLTEEELEVIHSHFEDEHYAKYVYCMAYLGFRPTAFFNLKKSDYHNEDGVEWLVGGIKTEAGKDRNVTIPPKILPIIHERLEVVGTDLLFPGYEFNKKHEFVGFYTLVHNHFSEKIFKPMMKRLGIEGRVPYSTRHSYSNKIKNATGADRDKADLIGHTNYDFTKKNYQSSTLKERKKITDQLE